MTDPYESDVPVDSEADWKATVTDPARKGLEAAGVPVSDLTDDQVLEASERIVDEFGGETPDLRDIRRIVAGIRFKATLVEGDDEPDSKREPVAPSAPRSADCPNCIPIKIPYPSGWWVVHSKFCPTHPMEGANYVKIRPAVGRTDAKTNERLAREHASEDARTGLTFGKSRFLRSCDKCGDPTFKFPYCDGCRSLLSIVKDA